MAAREGGLHGGGSQETGAAEDEDALAGRGGGEQRRGAKGGYEGSPGYGHALP